MTNIRQEIIQKITAHCKNLELNPDDKGYVNSFHNNLINNFGNWLEIQQELNKGQGSEMKPDRYGIIKFKAVHSSTALCVNNFAPFKQYLNKFLFLENSDFSEASFEKKLPTGISTPNLDFYLESSKVIIGFESKFTEILNKKFPNYNDNLKKYLNRNELHYLPREFNKLIQYYIYYQDELYLDVSQLIKHSIGLIRSSHSKSVQPGLVYIYWQPVNWYDFELYRKHESEIREFKNQIEKYVQFTPLSYLEFWKLYEFNSLFRSHIKMVKNRYEIFI
jgi:hypothetical protein